ncbi:DUF2637 domain-containing protein [Streptomyces sp. NPDC006692]|uniref:DUF2637 domain-containing protein n=1 Tax=unclassified Streptomyces TaxID=2593676 RepID=UPI0034169EC5
MHQQITPTPLQRLLIAVVIVGALFVAGIAFAGSYVAVRNLAASKGFGTFSAVFPIGIDFGILVVLSLDVLLTWLRCPFPLLRHTAWLLIGATIAFNAAVLWPDPLGAGMHAALPVIFAVTVEAARHAVGRLADLTEERSIESVRLARWLLSPVPTLKLWRSMQLWNRRSYQEALQAEQDRLLYIARLKQRHGIWWRSKASAEELLPLRLATLGVPLPPSGTRVATDGAAPSVPQLESPILEPTSHVPEMAPSAHLITVHLSDAEVAGQATDTEPTEEALPSLPSASQPAQPAPAREAFTTARGSDPADSASVLRSHEAGAVLPDRPQSKPETKPRVDPELDPRPAPAPEPQVPRRSGNFAGTGATRAEAIYAVFASLADQAGKYPSMPMLSKTLFQEHGITGRKGQPMSAESLRRYRTEWISRYEGETAGVPSQESSRTPGFQRIS